MITLPRDDITQPRDVITLPRDSGNSFHTTNTVHRERRKIILEKVNFKGFTSIDHDLELHAKH